MSHPRVAVITTAYFPDSHADVVATRLIKGYEWNGEHVDSRVEVVSFYLEQIDERDIGVAITDEHNIPRYPTVAEAISRGGTGVNVDGVIIIGEHGEFEYNEFEQKLYPRRRLFDAAVSTMVGAGRFVPIFNDKHLAWSFTDAHAMYTTAKRLGIPFLAGSTVPLAWRVPTAAEWPMGAEMTDIVTVAYGPTEVYGFHILEGMQVHAERRNGGETGVRAVRGLTGEAAKAAIADGTVDPDLLEKALQAFNLSDDEREQARRSVKDVFIVDYADGLRGAVVNCDEVLQNFAAAAKGPDAEMACQMALQGHPYPHFIYLTRHAETLMLDGKPAYPVERTYLTTGILDAAMRSRHDGGVRRDTPELSIAYDVPERIPDTAVYDPLPEPVATES
jgi:hypothetical protein